MVYIAPDGTVYEKAPWSINRVVSLFSQVIYILVYFFKSLFRLDKSVFTRNPKTNYWGGSDDYGHGGGGGPSNGGGNGRFFRPKGSGPTTKRIYTMRDINPPSVGGCPGGSCGL